MYRKGNKTKLVMEGTRHYRLAQCSGVQSISAYRVAFTLLYRFLPQKRVVYLGGPVTTETVMLLEPRATMTARGASGYRHIHKQGGKYAVMIYIGLYRTLEEAVAARDETLNSID